MNIGIVCYPTYGGSGVLATELGKALADKGHNIHFITYQQPVRLNGFHANIFYHEVRVPTYPLFDYPPYETALASTMVDVIINNDVELLHVHYAIPHASAAYMAKQILAKQGIKIPVVTTLHGTDITLVGRDKTYSPVVTFSMNESDAITAVSKNLRDETFNNFKMEKDIQVIYNFVDVKRFNRKPIDAFKKVISPNGEKILLHASNFRKVKRVDEDKMIVINDDPTQQKTVTQPTKTEQPKPIVTDQKEDVVEPQVIKPQPVTNGTFSIVAEDPQNIVMILDKVDPVYISEARNAFNRYNRENFSSQTIDITKDPFDKDKNFLIFSKFSDANAAIIYADRLKKNAPAEVSWLPANKYSFVIISDANLQVLKANKDLSGYIKLLNTKYPGKF